MAMPKKRMSHKRSSDRRAHHALTTQSLSVCTNCQAKILSHRVCANCGFYRGEQVIAKKAA